MKKEKLINYIIQERDFWMRRYDEANNQQYKSYASGYACALNMIIYAIKDLLDNTEPKEKPSKENPE